MKLRLLKEIDFDWMTDEDLIGMPKQAFMIPLEHDDVDSWSNAFAQAPLILLFDADNDVDMLEFDMLYIDKTVYHA